MSHPPEGCRGGDGKTKRTPKSAEEERICMSAQKGTIHRSRDVVDAPCVVEVSHNLDDFKISSMRWKNLPHPFCKSENMKRKENGDLLHNQFNLLLVTVSLSFSFSHTAPHPPLI